MSTFEIIVRAFWHALWLWGSIAAVMGSLYLSGVWVYGVYQDWSRRRRVARAFTEWHAR